MAGKFINILNVIGNWLKAKALLSKKIIKFLKA